MTNRHVTHLFYARLAGIMLLLYIVVGVASMFVAGQAMGGEQNVALLTKMAEHEPLARLEAVSGVIAFFIAVILSVALYVLTRDQDPNLALIAAGCRFGEAMINAISAIQTLELVSIAKANRLATPAEVSMVFDVFFKEHGSGVLVSSVCFAAGSSIYSYLFLRAGNIPVIIAWVGMVASSLLGVYLLVQMMGFVKGNWYIWMPMLVFEVTLAWWLIFRGVSDTIINKGTTIPIDKIK